MLLQQIRTNKYLFGPCFRLMHFWVVSCGMATASCQWFVFFMPSPYLYCKRANSCATKREREWHQKQKALAGTILVQCYQCNAVTNENTTFRQTNLHNFSSQIADFSFTNITRQKPFCPRDNVIWYNHSMELFSNTSGRKHIWGRMAIYLWWYRAR